jgi:phosphoglycolate phosphatase-like HAD superfamily hydrolase
MRYNASAVLRQRSLVAVTGIHHGLGNRVRVVLGSRTLAELEERAFFHTWHTGTEFGARFDELWQVDDRVISRRTARLLSLRYPFRDEKLEWLDDATRAKRVLQIRTPHALHLPAAAEPWEARLQALRPVNVVGDRVVDFFASRLAGAPYVGVMVRTHPNSHEATLRESPLDWFLGRMRDIRAERPDIQFFVSADTSEAQQLICEAIPGSHALTDKGGYNTREALQSSVSDLYLLAGSTHVLGPHFSSFPELAQKLAGPGLALETSHSSADTKWGASELLCVVDNPLSPHIRRTV